MQKIRKTVPIDIVAGWGQERDQELFKHKILVNIGLSHDRMIFEALRCYRCLFNKMIVISET